MCPQSKTINQGLDSDPRGDWLGSSRCHPTRLPCIGARGVIPGRFPSIRPICINRMTKNATTTQTCAPSPKQSTRDWIRIAGEIGWARPAVAPLGYRASVLEALFGLIFKYKFQLCQCLCDRIPSTTPGAEPPRDARDSGSARSHSTHLETSPSDRPKMVTYTEPQTVSSYMSVKCTRRTLRMPNFTRATHAQPSLSDFPWRDSEFWRADPLTRDDPGGTKFSHFPPK